MTPNMTPMKAVFKWVTLFFFIIWVNSAILTLAGKLFLNWSEDTLNMALVIMWASLVSCLAGFFIFVKRD